MEKSRYELFDQVLKRFNENGLLDQLIIIGSWCVYLYQFYFNDPDYKSGVRTRDIDFVVVNPDRINTDISIKDMIYDLGFVEDFKGEQGYTQFMHPELMLEFLIADRGKRSGKFYIPDMDVNAQPLRYLDFLTSKTVFIEYDGLKVVVPHPVNFALHKLLISGRRKNQKEEMDKRQGIEMMKYLVEKGEEKQLNSTINQIHKKWKKDIIRVLEGEKEFELKQIL